MADAVFFNDGQAKRIGAAVVTVENTPRRQGGAVPRGGGNPAQTSLVKIDGPKNADGLYPAHWYDLKAANLTLPQGYPCWVFALNGEALAGYRSARLWANHGSGADERSVFTVGEGTLYAQLQYHTGTGYGGRLMDPVAGFGFTATAVTLTAIGEMRGNLTVPLNTVHPITPGAYHADTGVQEWLFNYCCATTGGESGFACSGPIPPTVCLPAIFAYDWPGTIPYPFSYAATLTWDGASYVGSGTIYVCCGIDSLSLECNDLVAYSVLFALTPALPGVFGLDWYLTITNLAPNACFPDDSLVVPVVMLCTGTAPTGTYKWYFGFFGESTAYVILPGDCVGSGSGASGSGGSCNLNTIALGTDSTPASNAAQVHVNVTAGSLLVAYVGTVRILGAGSLPPASVKLGAADFTRRQSIDWDDGANALNLSLWEYVVPADTVGYVTASMGATYAGMLLSAVEAIGLAVNAPDQGFLSRGADSQPSLPDVGGEVTSDCEFGGGAFLLSPSESPTWTGDFVSGLQDVSVTTTAGAFTADGTYTLTEGFKLITVLGSQPTVKLGGTAPFWLGVAQTWK